MASQIIFHSIEDFQRYVLDVHNDLVSLYDQDRPPSSSMEGAVLNRCKEALERLKDAFLKRDATAPGGPWQDHITEEHWRKLGELCARLAVPLLGNIGSNPSAKSKFAAAFSVCVLAGLSACNGEAKEIVEICITHKVVDIFVNALRHELRAQNPDRTIRAMVYKLMDTLVGWTCYASAELQALLVERNVVDISLEVLTSGAAEPETKILASKALYNCLVTPGPVVTALRESRLMALDNFLQVQTQQVPDPRACAELLSPSASGPKAMSMPQFVPHLLSWVWYLPHYIVDHLIDSLSVLLGRLCALLWPEGEPGVPVLDGAGQIRITEADIAQHALNNRFFRLSFSNLFTAVNSGIADARLLQLIQGSMPPAAEGGFSVPYRLVKVLEHGRSDEKGVGAALELLDVLLAEDDCPLAADALAAGMLQALGNMDIAAALGTEEGIKNLLVYCKVADKLSTRAMDEPQLAARLRVSPMSSHIAYVAFLLGGKLSLKLEALKALRNFLSMSADMALVIVELPNFYNALCHTLLGGDPATADKKKQQQQAAAANPKSKKKKGKGAKAGTASEVATEVKNPAQYYKDQTQMVALEMLAECIKHAKHEPPELGKQIWDPMHESDILPKLVQHCQSFGMVASIVEDLLVLVGEAFEAHKDELARLGPMQAATLPYVLPLLLHEDAGVVAAATALMQALCQDMTRYLAVMQDVDLGHEMLRALVAVAPAISSADEVAAKVAELQRKAAAAAAAINGAAGAAPMKVDGGAGAGAEEAEGMPELVDVTAQGLGLLCPAMEACWAAMQQQSSVPTPAPSGSVQAPGAAGIEANSLARLSAGTDEGGGSHGGGAAAAVLENEELKQQAAEAAAVAGRNLVSQLLCCALLAEAALELPHHNAVRQHFARALAYARPFVEELRHAGAAGDAVRAMAERARAALQKVPVLNVKLLPKPQQVEEEEESPTKDKPPAKSGSKRVAGGANPDVKRQKTELAPEERPPRPQRVLSSRVRSTQLPFDSAAAGTLQQQLPAANSRMPGSPFSSQGRPGGMDGGLNAGTSRQLQQSASGPRGTPPPDFGAGGYGSYLNGPEGQALPPGDGVDQQGPSRQPKGGAGPGARGTPPPGKGAGAGWGGQVDDAGVPAHGTGCMELPPLPADPAAAPRPQHPTLRVKMPPQHPQPTGTSTGPTPRSGAANAGDRQVQPVPGASTQPLQQQQGDLKRELSGQALPGLPLRTNSGTSGGGGGSLGGTSGGGGTAADAMLGELGGGDGKQRVTVPVLLQHYKAAQKELNTLKAKYDELRVSHDKLQAERDSVVQQGGMVEGLRKVVEDRDQALHALEQKLVGLQHQLQTRNVAFEQLLSESARLRGELRDAQLSLQTRDDELARLQADNAHLRNELRVLENVDLENLGDDDL